MLNKLLGALGAVKNALSSDEGLIRNGLAGLERLNRQLAARAAHFVASGEDAAILADLRATGGESSVLLGQPGRLHYAFFAYLADKDDSATAKSSLSARHALYRRSALQDEDIDVLVRLGKVLDAADNGKSLEHAGAAMPDWLEYLLNDALWATHPEVTELDLLSHLPAWDISLLRAILAREELPPTMALPIVFERRNINGYQAERCYRRLLAPGALDEYMLAHPAEVESTAASLSAGGKQQLCQRIGGAPALLAQYAPLVLKLAVGDSVTVRKVAAGYLNDIAPEQRYALLAQLLEQGKGEERGHAADLLARCGNTDAAALLEGALSKESSKPVQQAIAQALSRLQAAVETPGLELPVPQPLDTLSLTQLADDALELLLTNQQEVLEKLKQEAAEEVESNRSSSYQSTHARRAYNEQQELVEEDLYLALRALNGEKGKSTVARLAYPAVLRVLACGGRLQARSDYGLAQAVRWAIGGKINVYNYWGSPQVLQLLAKPGADKPDMRQLTALAAECGVDDDNLGLVCLRPSWYRSSLPQYMLPPESIWPYFAERPALIDEGLGLIASKRQHYDALDLGQTLAVLATFPSLPGRWLPRAMELALGEGKTHRALAQQTLSTLPDIGLRVSEALKSGKQELRIEAARWLAKLDYRTGVPALYAALEKETRETASATLMTALEQLSEDLSPYLAPERLLAQARKGLKAKPPAGMAWIALDALPACRWLDGGPVEAELIRWWVILACKLKEPAGNALLERYLGLLEPLSRAALGSWLLHQFIAQDTRRPSHEEGAAWAAQHADERYDSYQRSAARHPEYYAAEGARTREEVFEEIKREKMSEYLGTAIGEKGMLALVSGVPAHELVGTLQLYMRDHYQRRSQVESLLEAACVSNQPGVIQFVLGIARRYRTASVQEKARLLVDRIAERNGWTQEQLGDRTIPTAGLDDSGVLQLQYGSREFSVVLDAALKPVLRNAEGKAVSALPSPRENDDAASIKEAKQLLTACKKELKQVLTIQSARLYEAMCSGRVWPVAEWREYLLLHPIMGRLVQRLVWMESDAEGKLLRLFRPTEDGSLIDIEDEEIALSADANVRLAHASLLDAAQAKAWLAHFKDYKTDPLFSQMKRQRPEIAGAAKTECIIDREGWISDTFTLRGAFTKLGYQRGQGEDGGFFSQYSKDFVHAGIRVAIEFSGNCLPEENRPAALKSLSFQQLEGNRFGSSILPLDKVPPVLLAEAYGDYHAVAAACAGFDPQWQSKMPW
nr:DUF4132 domain-containing protein [Massilia sp. YIM B04103]